MLSRVSPSRTLAGNVFNLTLGSALAQGITLVAAPLLTRLYTPQDYGLFGVFLGLLSLFSAIASLRYEIAIPLPEAESEAINLAAVSFVALMFVTTISVTVSVLAGAHIAQALGVPDLAHWLWLLPPALFLTGLTQVFSYWANRQKRFKQLAISRVAQSGTAASVQGGAGAWSVPGMPGLLGGYLAGQLCACLLLLRDALHSRGGFNWRALSPTRMRQAASRYADLPKHALFTSELNALSTHILNFALAALHGPFAAGLALLAQRIVIMPISFLSGALWQTSHAEIGRAPPERQAHILTRNHTLACTIFAVPLGLLAALSSHSALLFGPAWGELALVLPAISLMAYLNAVSNVTSYFAALGRFRLESMVNITLLLVKFLALASVIGSDDPYLAINVYALATALAYLSLNLFWGHAIGRSRFFFTTLLFNIVPAIAAFALLQALLGMSLALGLAASAGIALAHAWLLYHRFIKSRISTETAA